MEGRSFMQKIKSVPVKPSEITPEDVYLNRRQFVKTMGFVGLSGLLAACAPRQVEDVSGGIVPEGEENSTLTDELGNPVNSFREITNYNNFYEFTTDKERVAILAENFKATPWTIEVGGLVNKPQTLGIEDLLSKFTQEERIYRLRCVEAWSMVIPWMGFPLKALLDVVEPLSSAKYVRFETIYDPEQMRGQESRLYPWPYTEGLRLDEANHNLTILATGLYGKPMPNQNGAPIRLVVPWKYGFKSIKSIVKIELTEYRPDTLWNLIAPQEYGFFANVNPEVDHPRWSQRSERRIGETGRRDTLLFNGYAEEVASLYEGMDLERNY
jgi:methionine sulfoxide reductase catalytic subunit